MSINKNTPEAECLLKFVEEREKKKLSTILLFTGSPGVGKSYAGSRFLELRYQRRFNENFPINHVCETLEQATLLVKDFKRIGEGILIEELSVLASARDSLTTSNKLWNKFMDTCRIKQAIIVANCPHISFIDKHFIMLCQVWVNCERVDFKQKIVIARPLWIQTSPHKKEPYKHRFLTKNGEPIDYCFFRKPSEEYLKEYNKLKLESVHELYDEIALKMRHDRLVQIKKLGQKVLSPRETEAYTHWLSGLNSKEAAKEMKLGGNRAPKVYTDYLRSAKIKIKTSEYALCAKEFKKIPRKNHKTPHTGA